MNSLNTNVDAKITSLSYIERLIPDLKGCPCIILYRKILEETSNVNNYACQDNNKVENASDLNVTGSPLKYSFFKANLDDTSMMYNKSWRTDEEYYLPFAREEACYLINLAMRYLKQSSIPIFILCDGKDSQKALLLGYIPEGKCGNTILVTYKGLKTISDIQKDVTEYCNDHKLILNSILETTTDCYCMFQLFGEKQDIFDKYSNIDGTFEGSISLEISINKLIFDISSEITQNNLVVQIIPNTWNSLQELWKQLVMLDKYLQIREMFCLSNEKNKLKAEVLEFPKEFTSLFKEHYENIIEKIRLIEEDTNLNNFEEFMLLNDNKEDCSNESTMTLNEFIKLVYNRDNRDFIDMLWELLIKTENYKDLVCCLKEIFKKINNRYKPETNQVKAAEFMKIISDLDKYELNDLLLSSSSLELAIHSGIQKLSMDYTHLIMRTGFINYCNMQLLLPNISVTKYNYDVYRERLLALTQIHLCYEFMLFIQEHLYCSMENLRTLFDYAAKYIISKNSPVKDMESVLERKFFELTIPVPSSFIKDVNKRSLSTWRAILSSTSRWTKMTTTTYCSQKPIFPPNVYCENYSADKEMYYTINTLMSFDKF
ncbi:uncharacterized protein Zwilch isoform X2 [Prorops nasuta]